MRVFSMYVSRELYTKIRKYCTRNGLSMARFVALVLERELAQETLTAEDYELIAQEMRRAAAKKTGQRKA